MDFESVLELTAAILAEHRAAAAEFADRYRYFVVDEFQDVNPLQKLLLDAWTGDRDDVCVVGDPRQTIYSFTGATPAYLTGFTAEFPDATVVRLVRNYRSTPQVVALANRLAGSAGGRRKAARRAAGRCPAAPLLVAQRAAGPEPEFAELRRRGGGGGGGRRPGGRAHRVGHPAARDGRAGADQRPDRALRAGARGGGGALPGAGDGAVLRAGRGAPGDRAAAGRRGGPARPGARGEPPAEVRHVLSGIGLTREPPPGRGSARERWESLAALAQLAEDFCAATPGAGLADVAGRARPAGPRSSSHRPRTG